MDPEKLISLPAYAERYGLSLSTARHHIRGVPRLGWRVAGKTLIDLAVAEEHHRPRAILAEPRPKLEPAPKGGWPLGRPRRPKATPEAAAEPG
jgi:hypothetical protein